MSRPELVGAMRGNNDKYFTKGGSPGLDTDKGSNQYVGGLQLQDGYSNVAHQDAPDPVAYTQSKTSRRGGGFDYGEKQYIYKKVQQKQAPATQQSSSSASSASQAAAPAPEPEPEKDTSMVIQTNEDRASAKERAQTYSQSSFSKKYGQQTIADPVNAPDSFQNEQRKMDLSQYHFTPYGS